MRRTFWLTCLLAALALGGCESDPVQPGGSGENEGHDTAPPSDATATTESDASEGCEASPGPPPEGPTAPPLVTDEAPPTGAVTGRLVYPDGQPIEAMRMLACTPSICYWDETDSDGRFLVSDLTLEPLKMQTGDPSGAHLDVIFYHLLETEDVSSLPHDIIVPLRDDEAPVAWPEEGGAVTLAAGQLELQVEAGAVSYPVGTKEKAVRAMRLEGTELPPFDWTPWAGREDETFAFVVNPVGVTVTSSAQVRILGQTPGPCAVYRLWVVHAKTGALSYAGLMTLEARDGEAILVSAPDAVIDEFTTLILSPVEG
ncbi:MAG: hypothetical protein ACPGU1_00900 [Myxococcota bacterium]